MVGISPAAVAVVVVGGATTAVVWISPRAVAGLGGGGGIAPVGWISQARPTPESTHARAIANAKRLICPVSPLRMPVHWQENSIV